MDLSLPLQIFVITEWPGSTCKDPVRTDETLCSFSRQVKLCDAELRAL